MICPACRAELVIVETEGVEVDVCVSCLGMWFDADELRLLFEAAGLPGRAQALEKTLSESKSHPSPARRRCPRCRRRLRQIEAAARPHPLAIDRCPGGDGLWFDAGELQGILEAGVESDSEGLAMVQDFLGRFAAPRNGRHP